MGGHQKVPAWVPHPPFREFQYFLIMRQGLGTVYPSYSNSEKERFVCRPSRVDGIHDAFDKKKQAVKMADVFGIEKVWGALYENCRQHGDFATKRSNPQRPKWIILNIVRNEKLRATMVERSWYSWVWAQHPRGNDAENAQMCKTERVTRVRLLYCLSVVMCCLYWFLGW